MKLLALIGAGLVVAGATAGTPASAQHYRGGGYGHGHGHWRNHGYGYGHRYRAYGYRGYHRGYGHCRVFYRHGYRERRCY